MRSAGTAWSASGALAISASGTTQAGSALPALCQPMIFTVGGIDSRPTAAKAAIFAQKVQLER